MAFPIAEFQLLHPRAADGLNSIHSIVRDEIVGARYAIGEQMVRHGAQQLQHSGGVVAIDRIYSGASAVEFPDCNFMFKSGTIAITDLNQAFRCSQHQIVGEAVLVPRDLLGLANIEPFAPILLSIGSTHGHRLAAEMSRFFEAGEDYDKGALPAMLRDAMRAAWTPISDREEWWHGRRKLIHKYVETHLDDPNLGPLQICDLFNMSRATLYRMFERDGGVRRFIQDRRLYCAMWDLASGGVQRGRLSQVAERWGFSSDANFNRAVKLAFGMPPGALFKKSVHREPEDAEQSFEDEAFSDPISEWFRGGHRGSDVPNPSLV